MQNLVTEVELTNLMIENLSYEERYVVLEKAHKTLTNMVPHNRERAYKDLSGDMFGSTNYFMPQECFGGHCALEFMLGNNAVVENAAWRSPMRTKDSNILKLMKGADNNIKLVNEM